MGTPRSRSGCSARKPRGGLRRGAQTAGFGHVLDRCRRSCRAAPRPPQRRKHHREYGRAIGVAIETRRIAGFRRGFHGSRSPMMKAKKAKRASPAKQKPRAMRDRPKMPPISEEMKQWSGMLKTEVSGWPQISTKPMFGMMGLYRGRKIFGGLPVTRGFDTPNSVIFRFDPIPSELEERASKDSRIAPGKRWFSFNVGSTEDLRDALWWLNQAYERTGR